MQFRKLLLFFFACNIIYRNNAFTSNANNSQSKFITIDCFDQLADNQKLDAKDIYNFIDANSPNDCKKFCTQDGLRCLAFSFGFHKCQLSAKVIKEDNNLKPIGTVFNSNYKLYAKKRDCKIIQNSSLGSLSSDRKDLFVDVVKFVDLKVKDSTAKNRQFYDHHNQSQLKLPIKVVSNTIAVGPKIQDESTKSYRCFEQIFNEKKASKHFIRIITFCDSFTDCENRCLTEKNFYCFGFNFQRLSSSFGNKCELVDVPLSTIPAADAAHVWLLDHSFAYFERVANYTKTNCIEKLQSNQNALKNFEDCTNCGKKEHFYNNIMAKYYQNRHDFLNINRNLFRNEISNFRSSSENNFQIQKLNQDCSVRIKNGFKLYKSIVTKLLAVDSFYECEQLCYKEKSFNCRTYSYRYSFGLHDPTENCHLSDKPFQLIDTYNEVEQNQEYDIYVMNNLNECLNSIEKYENESDCFLNYKKGFRLHSDIVMGAKKTKSLSECEHECLITRDFVCRAFSFSDIDQNNLNCQLTNNEWLDYLMPDNNYQLFKRDSFGHGCEQNKFSYFLPKALDKKQLFDSLCYGTYSKSLRIRAKSSRLSLRNVNSDENCCDECTKLRVNGLLNCLSFSYSANKKLCEFSDLPVDQLIYEDCLENEESQNQSQLRLWNNINPHCNTAQEFKNYEKNYGSSKSNEYTEIINDYEKRPHHITVSGYKCKNQSFCRLNKLGNFWFCETENHLDGSWDYCCAADHKCGHSPDYEYKWCYVGQKKTQWRKCSTDQKDLLFQSHNQWTVSYLHKENPIKNNQISSDSIESYSEQITVTQNVTDNSQNSNSSSSIN